MDDQIINKLSNCAFVAPRGELCLAQAAACQAATVKYGYCQFCFKPRNQTPTAALLFRQNLTDEQKRAIHTCIGRAHPGTKLCYQEAMMCNYNKEQEYCGSCKNAPKIGTNAATEYIKRLGIQARVCPRPMQKLVVVNLNQHQQQQQQQRVGATNKNTQQQQEQQEQQQQQQQKCEKTKSNCKNATVNPINAQGLTLCPACNLPRFCDNTSKRCKDHNLKMYPSPNDKALVYYDGCCAYCNCKFTDTVLAQVKYQYEKNNSGLPSQGKRRGRQSGKKVNDEEHNDDDDDDDDEDDEQDVDDNEQTAAATIVALKKKYKKTNNNNNNNNENTNENNNNNNTTNAQLRVKQKQQVANITQLLNGKSEAQMIAKVNKMTKPVGEKSSYARIEDGTLGQLSLEEVKLNSQSVRPFVLSLCDRFIGDDVAHEAVHDFCQKYLTSIKQILCRHDNPV